MSQTAAIPLSSRPLPLLPNEILLITQSQWLFKEEELARTPSVTAGLTRTQERENRSKGINFILQVGIMLRLPRNTLTTASVFLHRFFMRQTMIDDKANGRQACHYYSAAATCIFLATKVEEDCRKMKELVVACVRVAQKDPNKVVDEQDKEFWRWRDTILQMEDLLLDSLCFDLSLEHPYTFFNAFSDYLGQLDNKPFRNVATAFLNDSFLVPLCVLWPPRTIAAAAVYAAARHLGLSFMDDKHGKPWWEVFGVDVLDLKKACNYMATIYENAPLRGAMEGSTYSRTPVERNDGDTKTRLQRPADEIESDSPTSRRRNSTVSAAGSDVSRKRTRVEENEVKQGSGLSASETNDTNDTDAKRRKVAHGTEEQANGTKEGAEEKLKPMGYDGGSEEGEVDE